MVPSIQARSMVEKAKPALERTKPERTLALVTDVENAVVVFKPKTTQPSTLMPYATNCHNLPRNFCYPSYYQDFATTDFKTSIR